MISYYVARKITENFAETKKKITDYSFSADFLLFASMSVQVLGEMPAIVLETD